MGISQSILNTKIPTVPVPKKANQMKTDEIADAILEGPGDPKIVGSYVYKRVMRDEEVDDIDMICNDTFGMVDHLKKTVSAEQTADPWDEPFEYTKLEVDDNGTKISIDIIETDEYTNDHRTKDTKFINAVQLTPDGLMHKDATLWSPKTDVVNYVMENMKAGRYAPWSNMRDKDEKYFENFEKIPEDESKPFGFSMKKSWFSPF